MAICHLLNLSYIWYVYMCAHVLKALFVHKSLLSETLMCTQFIWVRQYWCSKGYVLHAVRKHTKFRNKNVSIFSNSLCFTVCCLFLFVPLLKIYRKSWSSDRSRNYILKTIAVDWTTVFLKAQDKEKYCWKSTCTTCTIHWF